MSAAPADPNRSLLLGGGLLLLGFGVGFVVGQESTRHGRASAPVAEADPHAGHDHGPVAGPVAAGGGMSPAVMPRRTGHTFTGEISVPPHGDAGHRLASSLLAGAACPCGGCQGMLVLECGCDMAREIEGLAAHLLERGRAPSEVAAQLQSHYGLALAAPGAASRRAAPSPDPLSGLAEAFENAAGAEVGGPADVPTGARRTATPE